MSKAAKKREEEWKETAVALRNKLLETKKQLQKEKYDRRKAEQDTISITDTFSEHNNNYSAKVKKDTFHVDKRVQEELMYIASAHSDIQSALNAGKQNFAFKITKYAAIVIIAVIVALLVTREDVRLWVGQNMAGFAIIIIGVVAIFIFASRKKD